MFAGFVNALRNEGVKVSLLEYLTLLNGLKAQVALFDVEDFYFLARTSLVKDERLIDRFDRVFALYWPQADSRSFAPLNVDAESGAVDVERVVHESAA